MKKILVFAMMVLCFTSLFANAFEISKEALEQDFGISGKIEAAKIASSKEITKQVASLNQAANYFKVRIADTDHYTSGSIFQDITNVMDTYNNAKNIVSKTALNKFAADTDQPVDLKNGVPIVLSQYVNMESCMIASKAPSFAKQLETFGEEIAAGAQAHIASVQPSALPLEIDLRPIQNTVVYYAFNVPAGFKLKKHNVEYDLQYHGFTYNINLKQVGNKVVAAIVPFDKKNITDFAPQALVKISYDKLNGVLFDFKAVTLDNYRDGGWHTIDLIGK